MEATAQTPTTTFRWQREGLIVVLLIAGTFALYGRVAHFDFIYYDDPGYVIDNARLPAGLTPSSILWAFTTTSCSNWHPLTWLSYLLDAQIFGLRPGPMHIENAMLHAASTALLFVLLLKLTGNVWPSAWVAAMFAWHPLHVESVAWIAERKDVLSTFFLMLSLLAYVHYVRLKTMQAYGLVVAMLAMGLMAKPMLVTVPCLMLLLDVWPLRRLWDDRFAPPRRLARTRVGRLLVEKIPIFALVAASSYLTFMAQSVGHSVASLQTVPISMRLANAVVSYATYLKMTFVPRGLAIFYPHPAMLPGGTIPISSIALSAAILLTLILIAILLARRMPWLLVGLLWYFGTLVPVIGLVQVGRLAMADRYTYIPLIGVFIAIAWTLDRLLPRASKPIGIATLVLIAALGWRQIGYWRDSEILMTHAIAVVPNNYEAHSCLGQFYDDRGEIDRAAAEYHEALRIKPDSPVALYNLALQAQNRGDLNTALDLYHRAILADPLYAAAYNNYGNALAQSKRPGEAIEAYRRGMALDDEVPQLHHNFALLLAQLGQLPEAIKLWQKAITIDPKYTEARFRLGQALLLVGRTREGIDELRQALQIQPDRIDILNSLAWILATHPKPEFQNGYEAVKLASRARELTHNADPASLDILAAAEARVGRFDEAVQLAQSAAKLADDQAKSDLANAIRQRLQLYQNRQAFTTGG